MPALRDSTYKLFKSNNRHFLKILGFLAKFYQTCNEHLRKISSGTKVYYLSKDTQNKFIAILAENVLSIIVSKIKQAKYFNISLDCTPDMSKVEQMSLVIRVVTENKRFEYCIKKCFI